jgi:hypothetical protein
VNDLDIGRELRSSRFARIQALDGAIEVCEGLITLLLVIDELE